MDIENKSGYGEHTTYPDEIIRWNWGAFWLTWIWGIFNKSYISFLAFVPIANLFIPFYLGFNGNELAWKNKEWKDIDEFKTNQKYWCVAGWIFGVILATSIGLHIMEYQKMDRISKNLTTQVMEEIKKNEEANALLGENYTIAMDPATQSVVGSVGEVPTDHIIFITTEDGLIMVIATIDGNYAIKEISISPPDNGNPIIINMTD